MHKISICGVLWLEEREFQRPFGSMEGHSNGKWSDGVVD